MTILQHGDVQKFLADNGWRKYESHEPYKLEYWCKRYLEAPRCSCNADKEGMQVCIEVFQFEERVSYEICISAEKPDGHWVNLQVYGLCEELPAILDQQVSQLLEAWRVMHTIADNQVLEKGKE